MRKQTSKHDLEEGRELQLDFGKLAKGVAQRHKVIPVAVQDADSRELIRVAYTNEEALRCLHSSMTLGKKWGVQDRSARISAKI